MDNESASVPPVGRLAVMRQGASTLWTLVRYCVQDLRAKNAMTVSAALCFRTVFALVPALLLAFLVLKGAGMVEQSKQQLHRVLETTGLTQITIREDDDAVAQTRPASAAQAGVNLGEKIESIIESVERKLTFAKLGPVSLLLMAWSAITLLTTLERALNRIFEANRARPLAIRVLLYWSAVTFLPLVLMAMGVMLTVALRMISNQPWLAPAVVTLEVFLTLLMGVAVLACLYKFLPHTRVNFRHAVMAAAIVVPMWEIAKWAFSLYVTRVAGNSLYGGLGVLPLFFVWLNLCWYVLLVGAHIAHVLSNRAWIQLSRRREPLVLGPAELAMAACAVTSAYAASEGPVSSKTLAQRLRLPEAAVRKLLVRLVEAGLLARVSSPKGECYLPTRPPAAVSLLEIVSLDEPDVADDRGRQRVVVDPRLAAAVEKFRTLTHEAMGSRTLEDLMSPAPATVVATSKGAAAP